MDVLGETIPLIAADEAGIAKASIPLVTDARDREARAVIEDVCRAVGATFIAVSDSTEIFPIHLDQHVQSFDVQTPYHQHAGTWDIPTTQRGDGYSGTRNAR